MVLGINRNIVECKSTSPLSSSPPPAVLIETLWNVNSAINTIASHVEFRINRNIVECKLARSKAWREKLMVLIETLWNVNQR